MSKIKVAEIFYSLQGEGCFCGVPSIFLRTFGCNFTCSGFGMPIGQKSTERDQVAKNIDQYKRYLDLPLVHTGCDSYASWDPRFKDLSPVLEVGAIVDRFQQLLPDGKFGKDKHLIITGGEPLLGWQRSYPDLFEEIFKRGMGLTDVTFETNGTQPLSKDFFTYLRDELTYLKCVKVTFSISAKLYSSSGEITADAIKPDVVNQYTRVNGSNNCYFKFVVNSQENIDEIETVLKTYKDNGVNISVYLMPEGGTTLRYNDNCKTVAEYAMINGYRYSPRLQVDLWKNMWGT